MTRTKRHPIQIFHVHLAPPISSKTPKATPFRSKGLAVGLSTLLAVSETLPFLADYKGNGIVDGIKIGLQEIKKNL